jgi:phycocyanobilin:ferredoxin oxidoreductase
MITPFRLIELLRDAEARLVAGLGLEPLALPEELASAQGSWKGQPVMLATRAYRAERVSYARFAELTGPELEIGNALCAPRPDYPLPIFGADLVAFGREAGLIVADLSPTAPPGPPRDAQTVVLSAERARWPPLPSGGELPAWCAPWFSPFYLYTRITPTQREAAASAFATLPGVLIELTRTAHRAPDDAQAVARALEGYAAAHRDDDKGLKMLEKIFGPRWAGRYVSEVLFPSRAWYTAWK